MQITLTDYYLFLMDLLSGRRQNAELSIAKGREALVTKYFEQNQSLDILDLANGLLRPQYSILSATSHRVFGVDIANNPVKNFKTCAYILARFLFRLRSGLGAFDRAPKRLTYADVTKLPFANESFDLATSVVAFEHFLNVPQVLDELRRVLKPNGIAYIIFHPFQCLSGGHNLGFRLNTPEVPGGVDCWDHLRKRKLPFTVPLNEWRISDYLKAFRERFEILENRGLNYEGQKYLTPEIRQELKDYSEEELLCSTYLIIAKKKHT